MNAQEALNELHRMGTRYEEELFGWRTGDVDVMALVLQQLIDQTNAKPKTLEELGWELTYDGGDYVSYKHRKGNRRIIFWADKKNVRLVSHNLLEMFMLDLKSEEILAIADKMKELGMTNE